MVALATPAGPHVDLLAWRVDLPILGSSTYLINNSLGAMPRQVESELGRYARNWRERGVRAWGEGWWELPVAVGDLLAPLLGVGPGEVAMQPNVAVALAILLSALDYPAERNRIVTSELEFPNVRYVLEGERRKGADLVVVPCEGGELATEAVGAEVDERTRLVVTSHVLYAASYRVDAAALARRCREAGALFLLDVYQSVGAMPLELAAWGVDLAVGGSVKFLCGGPGAGFLWARPQLAERLEPAVTGWQADADPFAFRSGPIRRASGAWRFLTGTPGVPALHACQPGYRMVAAAGIDKIRARSLFLTGRLIEAADAHGLEVRTPRDPQRRGGAVTLYHPDGARLQKALEAEGILCDHRPGAGLRFGPHFYNTAEECDHAIERLAELVRSA
jgi:kynureninase